MDNKDGLNSDQLATDQDLKADAVDQQNLDDQVVQDQTQNDVLADGTAVDKTVKYSAMKAEIDARKIAEDATKAAQEQAAYAQRQLELMQRNQQVNTVQQPAAKTTYEQAMADVGVDADDLMLGENQVKVNNRKAELDTQMYQQAQSNMIDQQFKLQHSDYEKVVGGVNLATGQFIATPELLTMLQAKPYLAGACTTAQGAYNTVMEQRQLAEFKKSADINKEHLARTNANIATQPLGGSAAGGSGGVGDQSGQQLMTREQVLEIERKLAAGELINT